MEMAVVTLDTLDARLPVHEVYMLLHVRTIFDFRRMPCGDDEALQTWSNESIAWLVEHELDELDTTVVQNEALKVRMWLKGC